MPKVKDYLDGFSIPIIIAGLIIGQYLAGVIGIIFVGIIFFIASQILSYIIRIFFPNFDTIPGWIKFILALLLLYLVIFKTNLINFLLYLIIDFLLK